MSQKYNSLLPERLKRIRIERSMRQEDMGRVIGVTKGAISAYENGWRQPSDHILMRIAHEFRVSVDYLLGNSEKPNALYCKFTKEQLETAKEVLIEIIRILE